SSLTTFFVCWPIVGAAGQLFWPASTAALQDMVQPRMRARATAIYGVAIALIGLALGPYLTGKVAAFTGSIPAGVFTLFLFAPVILWMLWQASRRIAIAEPTRVAGAAGGEAN